MYSYMYYLLYIQVLTESVGKTGHVDFNGQGYLVSLMAIWDN